MKHLACTALLSTLLAATALAANATRPDLSGVWVGNTGAVFMTSFPTTRGADGSINAGLFSAADAEKRAQLQAAAGGQRAQAPMRGASAPPQYKDPANQAKAQELYRNGPKEDRVVACGQPGLPRIGAPRQIIQTAKQVVFLYDDLAGQVWRVIPTDGRGFRERIDPSFYGDSVGHWDGDTLVVEARNFTTDTWFGEYGYIHSDQMRVIERLTRKGDTLTYQATVEDPVMLKAPWVKSPVTLKLTDEALEEPLVCITPIYAEDAGHHEQRVP